MLVLSFKRVFVAIVRKSAVGVAGVFDQTTGPCLGCCSLRVGPWCARRWRAKVSDGTKFGRMFVLRHHAVPQSEASAHLNRRRCTCLLALAAGTARLGGRQSPSKPCARQGASILCRIHQRLWNQGLGSINVGIHIASEHVFQLRIGTQKWYLVKALVKFVISLHWYTLPSNSLRLRCSVRSGTPLATKSVKMADCSIGIC